MDLSNLLNTGLRCAGQLLRVKRSLASLLRLSGGSRSDSVLGYFIRSFVERSYFSECTNVHNLPEIFHYWSVKYLRPKFEAHGFLHMDMFFTRYLERCFARDDDRLRRFISIGSGNGESEVNIAKLLIDHGHENFTIECLDINKDMLERSQKHAAESGVAEKIIPLRADFNDWTPAHIYDAVMANQALHHVTRLEHLFASVGKALGSQGCFIVSDIIGRNGHLRWPETLPIIQEFWEELPDEYRFNQALRRYERNFRNDGNSDLWNFEGVRAQDILPLSVKCFHFDFFSGFANIIDPFIDRAFGHHFDVHRQWDRDFIDRVHARDESEMFSGRIKPTHMLAVMRNDGPGERCFVDGLSPEQSIREVR